MTAMLELSGLHYAYRNGRTSRNVLNGLDLTFAPGILYAITGPSGAGKTTLLSLLAGLDAPTAGTITFREEDVAHLGRDAYRRRHTAMIFQDLNLLDYLTPVENIVTGMALSGVGSTHRAARAVELLERLDVGAEHHRRSTMRLSGGQQQRVAIARAIASEADVLLADEPTGALDDENASIVLQTFTELAREDGRCVIVVTHSREVARRCDVELRLQRGRIRAQ
jgi:putative ABC transport system ATP-binding protein